MSDMTFEEFVVYMQPIHWRYVYIRSIEAVGYVSASHQNSGYPELNTITVSLLDEDGRWSHDGISVKYTMDEARRDLVPDIKYLIEESPL